MHSSTILALIGASSLAAATPLLQSRAVTKFPPGLVWDIVLDNHYVDLGDLQKAEGTVIDIDLLDPVDSGDTTLIPELAKTKLVICYFSAGSREDWRADAGKFEANDYGQPLDPQWTGERWTNVKSDNVKAIMKSRIEKAAEAGCHAVDPDNVDGYNNNQDGFGYDRSDYVEFIEYMAGVAHDNGLAIGLKNGVEMIEELLPVIDFAVNEQCHEYKDDCASYEPVTSAGLAVFNIEYNIKECSKVLNFPGVNLSTILKEFDLQTIGGQC